VGNLGYVVQERLDHEVLRNVVSTSDNQGGDSDVLQTVDNCPIGEDRTPVKAVTTIISPPWGTMRGAEVNRTF
jgi:hypothetical protein